MVRGTGNKWGLWVEGNSEGTGRELREDRGGAGVRGLCDELPNQAPVVATAEETTTIIYMMQSMYVCPSVFIRWIYL